jgi:hypothetical protein
VTSNTATLEGTHIPENKFDILKNFADHPQRQTEALKQAVCLSPEVEVGEIHVVVMLLMK